ncbi:MAG: aminotransferase [Pseudomonadota bacterium]
MLVQSYIASTEAPPVMEARRWIDGVTFSDDRPLINVSQAAPVDPPPLELRQVMADFTLHEDDTHLYGPVLGLPELRSELAANWSAHYGGDISENHVAITSGCNQAFVATMMTLAAQGDEVILPTPWYFNHKMWLDMVGVKTVPLYTGDDLVPSAEAAAKLITDKTRAIALVTPNNPSGVEYPAEVMESFAQLCREKEITLIVDETYRDFDSRTGAPHDLLAMPDWQETIVQLYSFSKAYRLTGHRVGAMIASPERLYQVEKFLDTVAICPNQLGQKAALWGLRNLGSWLAEQREEILARRAAIEAGFPKIAGKGWQLLGCGAYFAYVAHPFAMNSADLAKTLVKESALLALPGTMFMPESSSEAGSQMRIAYANIDANGIDEMFNRLSELSL